MKTRKLLNHIVGTLLLLLLIVGITAFILTIIIIHATRAFGVNLISIGDLLLASLAFTGLVLWLKLIFYKK